MSEKPLNWSSHPVDVLKHFAEQSGMTLLPEVEARMRAVCDEEVVVCRKCNVEMLPGKAFATTFHPGMPDFPGQTDLRGQTMIIGGSALVDVLKCPSCGHSIRQEAPVTAE